MQNPRTGLSLRIDTDVGKSHNLPSSTSGPSVSDALWRTPVTPSTPGLLSSTTSASNQTPVTPTSGAPWTPTVESIVSPGPLDIDIINYTNVVHGGEPKEHGTFASISRLGNSVRGLLRSKSLHEKDTQLGSVTASLIERDLRDWSIVEDVLRRASTTSANTSSVLKVIVRKLMAANVFEQLSAGRLWAILMKRPSSVLYERATRADFLAELERAISSPYIEMVAADRVITVIATAIHEFPYQKGTDRLKQLWGKLGAQRVLDKAPIHPEDPLYSPGSLLGPIRGISLDETTVPTPYYASQAPPNSLQPSSRPTEQSRVGCDDAFYSAKAVKHPLTNMKLHAKRQNRVVPEVVVEEDEDVELPPPYSPSQVASTSASSRMPSVVDTYPFAKGYANDVGPDIDIDSLEPHPFARGAFGDVRRASLRNGTPVAIKCLRFYTQAQDTGRHKLEKKSLKEIRVWSFLNHDNVLPLLGLCIVNNELGMVSELMPNGNIQDYIRNNPSANRYQLAIRICTGLVYLHEHPKHVVHGDLKALNVVVDAHGVPKLTDFGLAQMIRAEDSTERSSSCAGGTSRWMAPELIGSDSPNAPCGKPSFASDVHALGMTIYEIFSGTLPFFGLKREPQVILAIMNRELPERIPGIFTDELWDLLHQCWRYKAQERPTARQVLHALQELHRRQTPV
ncbi:unnamed protein product [Rhizoctonia solani]|uniref:Uncharacterized protein n=1 Tax=Rhizoctonia solani TaxID=456999 RepID=A0A8H3D3N4_9AGAM|nr:unnamed protein product [Rhizoctonia solani]